MLDGNMLLAWRVFSVLALLGVMAGAGFQWLEHGVRGGDYGYAGLMIAIIWWAFYLIARISAVPDPALRRILIRVAAALVLPTLVYHAYDATNPNERLANLVMLLGVSFYSYAQIFGKRRTENTTT